MSHGSELPKVIDKSQADIDAAIAAIKASDISSGTNEFIISCIRLAVWLPHHFDGMADVFNKNNPVNDVTQLKGKKLAAQIGSTMEIWLKKTFPNETRTPFDNNNQAIEALKAGHVDVVLMDGSQGAVFSQKNPGLAYAIITQSKDGYALALKKSSSLTAKINDILKKLEAEGEIKKLKQKWLGESK